MERIVNWSKALNENNVTSRLIMPQYEDIWNDPRCPKAMKNMGRHMCSNCGGKQMKLISCSKCLVARYCSKHCQETHWHKHHKSCCKYMKKSCISELSRQVLFAFKIHTQDSDMPSMWSNVQGHIYKYLFSDTNENGVNVYILETRKFTEFSQDLKIFDDEWMDEHRSLLENGNNILYGDELPVVIMKH